VIGATWFDQQLIGVDQGLGDMGFGSEVKDALCQRTDFLTEQGLAEKRGQREILASNLLATLREREVAQIAQAKQLGKRTRKREHRLDDWTNLRRMNTQTVHSGLSTPGRLARVHQDSRSTWA
jgi:hypothetical protein